MVHLVDSLMFAGSYKYTWTMIQHPDGDQVGQMEDSSTSTFKLSNVSLSHMV